MKAEMLQKPLIMVYDPSLVFVQILKVVLHRTGCEVEITSFQQSEMTIFWLSGEMDKKKAAKRPLATPWDEYPALQLPAIAIVNLGFPIGECEVVMDRLYLLSRDTKIITTSTKEELLNLEDLWDEVYWRHVVSHLPQPVTVKDMVERLVAVLHL